MSGALQSVCVLVLLLLANVIAAGTMWVLGTVANVAGLGEFPLVWEFIALIGVAAGIGSLWAFVKFMARRPRKQAPVRA